MFMASYLFSFLGILIVFVEQQLGWDIRFGLHV